MTRVLIIDDHQIIIDGIKVLVQDETDFTIVHESQSGVKVLEMIESAEIDLVMLDINLPDMNGFDICKNIKKHKPEVKVIAMTMHGESGYISKMLKMGVDGYILKNAGKEEMVKAIRAVTAGDSYFSSEVTNNLISGLQNPKKAKSSDFIQQLTRREKEVLHLIVDELTTDEIAKKLFISSTTVISHRKSLLRKLNAKNTAGLVKNALQFGLLED